MMNKLLFTLFLGCFLISCEQETQYYIEENPTSLEINKLDSEAQFFFEYYGTPDSIIVKYLDK